MLTLLAKTVSSKLMSEMAKGRIVRWPAHVPAPKFKMCSWKASLFLKQAKHSGIKTFKKGKETSVQIESSRCSIWNLSFPSEVSCHRAISICLSLSWTCVVSSLAYTEGRKELSPPSPVLWQIPSCTAALCRPLCWAGSPATCCASAHTEGTQLCLLLSPFPCYSGGFGHNFRNQKPPFLHLFQFLAAWCVILTWD